MNKEILLLFNDKINVNEYKWMVNKAIKDSIIYKNALIENVIKYPISESDNNKSLNRLWEKLLGIKNISIDNINEVLNKYDILAHNNLKKQSKKGYIITERNSAFIYNDDDIVTQLQNNGETFIQSCFIKTGQVDMFPLFYNLKYNSYNLFYIDINTPIEYYDDELKEKIENIINKNLSFKESIIEYVGHDDKYITYSLIRDYYNKKTNYTKFDLERYIKHLENDITSIIRDRRKIIKLINKIDEEMKEIDDSNKKIIFAIRLLNIFIDEYKQIKEIKDDKIRNNKNDKFVKQHSNLFIDFSQNGTGLEIEEYVQIKINNLYKEIENYSNDKIIEKKLLKDKIENDILNNYIIGIDYYLIMISISLSNNELESIYEGNLINKAIFNVKEIKELINLINKNLLD